MATVHVSAELDSEREKDVQLTFILFRCKFGEPVQLALVWSALDRKLVQQSRSENDTYTSVPEEQPLETLIPLQIVLEAEQIFRIILLQQIEQFC